MKQNIRKWMYCAFVLCATVCLVACDKNNDPVSEKITGKVTYKLNDIYDLKDLADITIVYTDATGKNVTETVASTTWEKTVDVNVGFKAYMKVSHKKKANISWTKASYKIENNFSISCKLSNGETLPNRVNMDASSGLESIVKIALNKWELNPKELSLEIKDPLKEYME